MRGRGKVAGNGHVPLPTLPSLLKTRIRQLELPTLPIGHFQPHPQEKDKGKQCVAKGVG